MDKIGELSLYFAVEYNVDGILLSDDLVPDGGNTPVTNSNLDDYIHKRIQHMVQKNKLFVNEIKTGIFSVFFIY